MGTSITDWAAVDGAFYTGAASGEVLWLIISVVLTVLPLYIGHKHEFDAYEKLKK